MVRLPGKLFPAYEMREALKGYFYFRCSVAIMQRSGYSTLNGQTLALCRRGSDVLCSGVQSDKVLTTRGINLHP